MLKLEEGFFNAIEDVLGEEFKIVRVRREGDIHHIDLVRKMDFMHERSIEYMRENNDKLDAIRYSIAREVNELHWIYGWKNRLPKKVQFNDKKKATTIIDDNKVTVVKTMKGDKYNKEFGFLMAYFQHYSGLSKTQAKKYLKGLLDEKN